jgi:glycosyltransferase involved in cell wall biosynthesis
MVPPNDTISILMPAYRLADTIGENIDRVARLSDALGEIEIIVCDDGSDDGTGAAAVAAAAMHPNAIVLSHEENRGKGAALKTAFLASKGRIVVFLDGDLDLPPGQVPSFIERFEALGVDGLVGSKRDAMAAIEYPAIRRVLSNTYTTIVHVMFRLPVRETQTGLKVFTRDALDDVMPVLQVNRYTFDIELLVRMNRLGMRLAETPVMLGAGAATTGLSAGTLVEMARDTLLVWLRSFRWPKRG